VCSFEPQIRQVVQKRDMPGREQRQTLMFSATFPAPIQKLAGEFMRPYIWIGVGRVGSSVESIKQAPLLPSVLIIFIFDNNSAFHRIVEDSGTWCKSPTVPHAAAPASPTHAQELLLAVNDKRRKMEMLVEALRGETPLARTLVFVQK